MGVTSLNSTIRFLKSLFDSKEMTVPALKYNFEKPKFNETEICTPFERCMPEEAGISSIRVKNFLKKLRDDPTLNMHSVMILSKNKIICEAAFGAQRTDIAKATFSECKSIVSLALGVLIEEGKVHLSDKLIDIFQDKINAVSRIQMRELTVADLLIMKSGAIFNELNSLVEEDWEYGFMKAGLKEKPGEIFNYNSMNTFMLAAVIERKSGTVFWSYVKEKLFDPLNISNAYWEKSPLGIEKGGWGLYIKPEDLAKFGRLIFTDGVWNGRQIVSREYIKQATMAHSKAPESCGDFDYGFQIWCARDKSSFLFNGLFGQNVLGFYNNEILLVTNAGNDETFQQSNYFKYAYEFFTNTIDDDLSKKRKNYKELCKYIQALSTYPKLPEIYSKIVYYKNKEKIFKYKLNTNDPASVSVGLLPIILQVSENTYTSGLKSVEFEKVHDIFYMLYEEKENIYRIPFLLNKPVESDLIFGKLHFKVAAKAELAYDEDANFVFKMRLDFLETPCSRIIKLHFKRDRIILEQSELPGENYIIKSADKLILEDHFMGIIAKSNIVDKEYILYKVRLLFHPKIEMKSAEK